MYVFVVAMAVSFESMRMVMAIVMMSMVMTVAMSVMVTMPMVVMMVSVVMVVWMSIVPMVPAEMVVVVMTIRMCKGVCYCRSMSMTSRSMGNCRSMGVAMNVTMDVTKVAIF